MLFYVFETHGKNIYKFGMSKKQLSIDRLCQYEGINKPKRIITLYNVSNGFEEEGDFKSFLTTHNIPIIAGREYFKYEGNIVVLISKYRLASEGIKLNIQTNLKQETVFKNVTATLDNDKTKKNEMSQKLQLIEPSMILNTLLSQLQEGNTMSNDMTKPMLPQDMKKCSVCCVSRPKSDFNRKYKTYKSCNRCSQYRKRYSQSKKLVEPSTEVKSCLKNSTKNMST